MSQTYFRAELEQDGIVVAIAEAPHVEGALSEIEHYNMLYLQDGPTTIRLFKVEELELEHFNILLRD